MAYNGNENFCSCDIQSYSILFRRVSDKIDEAVFVDGSRYCVDGRYVTGYSIWYPERDYFIKHKLPGHFSAQRAELQAIHTVLEIDKIENRSPLVIYSDSSYVVRSLTDYLPIWKRRGFVDASNKVLAHKDTLESIFDLADKNPLSYAIVKVPSHRPDNDELSVGNRKADSLAKEAAIDGETVIQFEPTPVCAVKKSDSQVPSFADEQKKDASLSDLNVGVGSPFVCENGILCHSSNGILCPVVPEHLQKEYTKYNHDSLGHIGKQRLLEILKEKFYWEKMEETVDHVIRSCLICAQVNTRPKGQKPPLQRIPPADGPWSSLQIDYIGPLPTGKSGFRYALVVVDIFSKWVEILPVRKDALTTARMLIMFLRFGVILD